jgi:hypothetical protein
MEELPAVASDDELVAWGRSLTSVAAEAELPSHPRRTEPLRARRIPRPEQRIRLRPRGH